MMPKTANNKNYKKTENLRGTSNQTQTKRQGKKILHKQKIHKENIAPTVRIRHINPQGMLTPGKILSLQKFAAVQHLDVLALTETHLTEHNLDLVHEVTGKRRLIIIPSPFRQYSQQGKGGIALMVKEHISSTPRENHINDETARLHSWILSSDTWNENIFVSDIHQSCSHHYRKYTTMYRIHTG